ncbi:hypothetical protein FOZ61_010271 [Perkinsus olseni]|uniref:Uncharacterized protein n=1 Tax=Perkinsus olseni TaxID=32597 RepID=A0A7J6KWR2_PEROL|nr:hypothetical protein FOZ61_010271 [Perkinsus olseni]
MDYSRHADPQNNPNLRLGDGLTPLQGGLQEQQGEQRPPPAGGDPTIDDVVVHPPLVLPTNATSGRQPPTLRTTEDDADGSRTSRGLPPPLRQPNLSAAQHHSVPQGLHIENVGGNPTSVPPLRINAPAPLHGVVPTTRGDGDMALADEWPRNIYQRGQHPVPTDHRAQLLPPPPPHYGPPHYIQSDINNGYRASNAPQPSPSYYVPGRPLQHPSDQVHHQPHGQQYYYPVEYELSNNYPRSPSREPTKHQPYQRGQPQLLQDHANYMYPQPGVPPHHAEGYPPVGPLQPAVSPSPFYVPRKRGMAHYGWCEGCSNYACSAPVSIKDYDSAERVVDSLKPRTIFKGCEDNRSGTSFIETMYTETEGHPDVVRYLWLKRYTTSYVWSVLTDGIQPPTRCHRSYARQLQQLLERLRYHYDTLGHVQRTSDDLAHCVQEGGTVYKFI